MVRRIRRPRQGADEPRCRTVTILGRCPSASNAPRATPVPGGSPCPDPGGTLDFHQSASTIRIIVMMCVAGLLLHPRVESGNGDPRRANLLPVAGHADCCRESTELEGACP